MSTLTLPNGTVLTRVTRASCLARIAAIRLGSIWYDQGAIAPSTDRRADCSGLGCYVMATPKSGPGIYLHAHNTGSLVREQVIERIGWADLLPGDFVGYCAPDSPGNGGHIAIWKGGDRRPDGRLHVWDHGSTWGPKDRWVQWDGVSTGWLAPKRLDGSPGLAPWRFVGVTEEGEDMAFKDDVDAWFQMWRTLGQQNMDDPVVIPDHVPSGTPGRSEPNVLAQTLRRIEARLVEGTVGGVDTAAVLAEIRDAVADLGEGGSTQVRADA